MSEGLNSIGLFLAGWGLLSVSIFALMREIRNSPSVYMPDTLTHRTYEGNDRISQAFIYMAWSTPVGLMVLFLNWMSSIVGDANTGDLISIIAQLVSFIALFVIFFLSVSCFWLSETKSERMMREAEKDGD
jgi:hypothetical protein